MTTTADPGPRSEPEAGPDPLLEVRDLSVRFRAGGRSVTAVDQVSFAIRPGQHVGLVGESGSGKSVTSLAVMGLLPRRGAAVTGEIRYRGQDLLGAGEQRLARLRGREIAMVFQDPMTSLNPVVPVGVQVTEVIRRHERCSRRQARERAADLLHRVGIPDPRRRLGEYPHQLSGGMRQRVLIAIALACSPRLLTAAEPTTALDVTIQAQVLEVLKELVADTDAALLMITHDLGVVAGLCDEVNVMYAGRIVESASRGDLFADPRHPYTHGLLRSIPRLDSPRAARLTPIPGSPTQTLPWSEGCAFAPRCRNRVEECVVTAPTLVPDASGSPDDARGGPRALRCFHPVETAGPAPEQSQEVTP